MTSDLLRAIRMKSRSSHDTLYCNKECKQEILREIGGRASGFQTTDNVTIEGLTVEAHERFTVPITCEKGDIFPLTEDWKDDE